MISSYVFGGLTNLLSGLLGAGLVIGTACANLNKAIIPRSAGIATVIQTDDGKHAFLIEKLFHADDLDSLHELQRIPVSQRLAKGSKVILIIADIPEADPFGVGIHYESGFVIIEPNKMGLVLSPLGDGRRITLEGFENEYFQFLKNNRELKAPPRRIPQQHKKKISKDAR